jgi:hypothetical protein
VTIFVALYPDHRGFAQHESGIGQRIPIREYIAYFFIRFKVTKRS